MTSRRNPTPSPWKEIGLSAKKIMGRGKLNAARWWGRSWTPQDNFPTVADHNRLRMAGATRKKPNQGQLEISRHDRQGYVDQVHAVRLGLA